jgi:hypothetical protein
MLTEAELHEILAGGAKKIIDAIHDETFGASPNRKQSQEDVEKSIADALSSLDTSKLRSVLEANPALKESQEGPQMIVDALSSLDWSKVHSAMQAHIEEAFSQIHQRNSRSRERLQSDDRSIQLDELCRVYARDTWDWSVKAEYLGLSEDELAKEAQKRGLHLQLDLDKSWDQMHELLTGITLRERRDLAYLSRAQPWIEKAKLNASFPSRCVIDIEESKIAVEAARKEMYQAWKKLEYRVLNLPPATEEDSPEEDALRDLFQIVNDIVTGKIWHTPETLYSTLMQIAAMQKRNDEALIKKSADKLRESAKLAKLIESSMTDLLMKLRAGTLGEADQKLATRVYDESTHLSNLLCVRGWLLDFLEESTPYRPPGSSDDTELLSIAVAGGTNIPDTDGASYLTLEQVKAIANVLEQLTHDETVGVEEGSYPGVHQLQAQLKEIAQVADDLPLVTRQPCMFDRFKAFYVRAARSNNGVLVKFSS